jgi:hypothetical protein
MNITVNISVSIERADGTVTHVRQERTDSVGDNPRFEAAEVEKSITTVVDAVTEMLPTAR